MDAGLSSKVWKERLAAYEQLKEAFETAFDSADPVFSNYADALKGAVADKNLNAQTAGAIAAKVFVDRATVAPSYGGALAGALAKNALHQKPKTKEEAIEVFKLLAEIGCGEAVADALVTTVSNSKLKMVLGGAEAMVAVVSEYGVAAVPPRPILAALPKLLSHGNDKIRDQGRALAVVLYGYIGPAVPAALSSLRAAVITSLEKAWADEAPGSRAPTKLTRAEQEAAAAAAASGPAAAAGPEATGDATAPAAAVAAAAFDPLEFVPETDVIGKLPNSWFGRLEEKKWSDRKEAVTDLQSLVDAPKLADGDYSAIVEALIKLLKDSNIFVAIAATEALGALATGLGPRFSQWSRGTINPLLAKLKDKKAVAAIGATLVAMIPSTSLSAVAETAATSLGSKVPSVRLGTAEWLADLVAASSEQEAGSSVKALWSVVDKTSADRDAKVRAAAVSVMASFVAVLGSKAGPLLAKLDDKKKARVEETAAALRGGGNTTAPAASGSQPAQPAQPAGTSASAPVQPAAARSSSNSSTSSSNSGTTSSSTGGSRKGKAPATATSTAPAAAAVAAPTPAVAAPAAAAPTASGAPTVTASSAAGVAFVSEPMAPAMSDEDAAARFGDVLPAGAVAGIASSKWKERLEAMDAVDSTVEQLSTEAANEAAPIFTAFLSKKPGFTDNNVQVLSRKFAAVAALAEKATTFSTHCARQVVSGAVAKIHDRRAGEAAAGCLSVLCEAVGPAFVLSEVFKAAAKQKVPANAVATTAWVRSVIEEFAFAGVESGPVIAFFTKSLSHSKRDVREEAIAGMACLFKFAGAPILKLIEKDVKPALFNDIKAACDATASNAAPPTRFYRRDRALLAAAAAPGSDGGADGASGAAGAGAGVGAAAPMVDILPRTDISSSVKDSLLAQFGHSSWKERKDALDKSLEMVERTGGRITSNIEPLVAAVKSRLKDKNKNLVTQSLRLFEVLTAAMGADCARHTKTIVPGACMCLSDNKAAVRAAAITVLETFAQQAGMAVMVSSIASALMADRATGRKELIAWLAGNSDKLAVADDLGPLMKPMVSCLEDKNAQVRNDAESLLAVVVPNVGHSRMTKACSHLKKASSMTVKPIIDQYKGVAAGSAPAAAATGGASGAATAASSATSSAKNSTKSNSSSASGSSQQQRGQRPGGGSRKPSGKGRTRPGTSSSRGRRGPGGTSRSSRPASAKPSTATSESVSGDGPVLIPNNGKAGRARKNKSLAWKLTTLRPDLIDMLEEQVSSCCSSELTSLMFARDFKSHLAALDVIAAAGQSQLELVDQSLDVILKWVTVRLHDTNTTVIVRCLDTLRVVFEGMSEANGRLSDYEASVILPVLVVKLGSNKETQRNSTRELLKTCCDLYPASKIAGYLVDGFKEKNARCHVECIEELGRLIGRYGLTLGSPAKLLGSIAKWLGCGDSKIRGAATDALMVAYGIEGEAIFGHLKRLPDAHVSLLRERIKYSGTAPPAPGGSGPGVAQPTESTAATVAAAPAAVMAAAGTVNDTASAEADSTDTASAEAEDVGPTASTATDDSGASTTTDGPVSPQGWDEAWVMSGIRSGEEDSTKAALGSLKEWIEKDYAAVAPSVNAVVSGLVLQLHLSFVAEELAVRLAKHQLDGLMEVFLCPRLAVECTRDTLQQVFQELVLRLLDSRLTASDELKKLLRGLNKLMLNVMAAGDRTRAFCALLSCLESSLGTGAASVPSRFTDLVVKCLLRMTKTLSATGVIEAVDVDALLGHVHRFLTAHPPESWEGQSSDLPLRAVKTIVSELVGILGTGIYDHFSMVPTTDEADGEVHLTLFVKAMLGDEEEEGVDVDGAGVASGPGEAAASAVPAASGPGAATTSVTTYSAGSAGGSETSASRTAAVEPATTAATAATATDSSSDGVPTAGSAGVAAAAGEAGSSGAVVATPPRAASGTAPQKAAGSASPSELKGRLGEIFLKIGARDSSAQGIRELHQFRVSHPEIDIEPELAKTSDYFQKYIREGLDKVAVDGDAQPGAVAVSPPTAAAPPVDSSNVTGAADETAAADENAAPEDGDAPSSYLDRLRRLQERFQIKPLGDATDRAEAAASNVAPSTLDASATVGVKSVGVGSVMSLSEVAACDKAADGSGAPTADCVDAENADPAANINTSATVADISVATKIASMNASPVRAATVDSTATTGLASSPSSSVASLRERLAAIKQANNRGTD